jgi:hypothetical protein
MATFPAYAPTKRQFNPGTYPQKSYRSLAGIVVKRTFGNRPTGATLNLDFENIADDKVVAILNHYRSQTAVNQRFKVTATTTAGLNSNLTALADGSADNLRWEYSQPPAVESIRPGVSRVQVQLLGEIRDPGSDD